MQKFQEITAQNKEKAKQYNLQGSQHLSEKSYDLACKAFYQAIGLNPLFSEAFYSLGLTHAAQDQTHEALECFSQAIVLAESNHDHEILKKSHCQILKIHWTAKNDAQAIKTLSKLIELEPAAHFYYMRGSCKKNLSPPQEVEAIFDFDKAIQLNPLSYLAHFHRSKVYGMLGNRPAALENPVINIDQKTDSDFYYKLAKLYAKSKSEFNAVKAILNYCLAIQKDPTNTSITDEFREYLNKDLEDPQKSYLYNMLLKLDKKGQLVVFKNALDSKTVLGNRFWTWESFDDGLFNCSNKSKIIKEITNTKDNLIVQLKEIAEIKQATIILKRGFFSFSSSQNTLYFTPDIVSNIVKRLPKLLSAKETEKIIRDTYQTCDIPVKRSVKTFNHNHFLALREICPRTFRSKKAQILEMLNQPKASEQNSSLVKQ